MVLPACVQDRDGGLLLLHGEREKWPRLRRVWADGGYAGAKPAASWHGKH